VSQKTLFDNSPKPAARARKSDPITSVIAAERVERNGTAQSNRDAVRQCVQQQPGMTSAEIARVIGVDRHEGGRRVSDLVKAMQVKYGQRRLCTVRGTSMQTVWPSGFNHTGVMQCSCE
tara:strand:+ start:1306 stop:1662 length:357 start_codon:yes stop_codon:yes gene_type:complete